MASLKKIKDQFRDKLIKQYFVRWHMSLILAATIASGIVIDKGLHWLGMGGMGWRYALSVLAAYGVFFLLVRMWVWYAAGVAPRFGEIGDVDLSGVVDYIPGPRDRGNIGFRGFRGGSSGGGGASDLFDSPGLNLSGVGSSPSGGGGSSLSLDFDLDEGIWIVIVLAIVVVVICAAGGYLVWMAPEILPEVALEAAIGAGLLKQIRSTESGWARRLLWKTWIPLTIVVIISFFAGVFIQSTFPSATNVRGALHCAVTAD